jgi:hypothetical protein
MAAEFMAEGTSPARRQPGSLVDPRRGERGIVDKTRGAEAIEFHEDEPILEATAAKSLPEFLLAPGAVTQEAQSRVVDAVRGVLLIPAGTAAAHLACSPRYPPAGTASG